MTSRESDSDAVLSMASAMLPEGGLIAIMMHVYFDESGTHDGAPVMTMAGYLMTDAQARRFTKDWARDLKKIGIPFAHMTDCANGNGPYKRLSHDDRLQSEKLLIGHIRRRTVLGFGVSLDPNHYKEVIGPIKGAPTAYGFCVLACLNGISKWAEKNKYYGKIAYFFEAGHRHQAEANQRMAEIPLSDKLMRVHRYAGHAFADKTAALPLQAADMLAWQASHYHKRSLIDGHTEPRKDFVALLRPQDMAANYTRESIEGFRESLEEIRRNRGHL